MRKTILSASFFNRDPLKVAKSLLGKVLCVKYNNIWLQAIITETEAYYLDDKASHASLGYTDKRRALFMSPGTIYMYYSRGGDSINISCRGEGNAILIKSGAPFKGAKGFKKMIETMKFLNPKKECNTPREVSKLCSGQALLCRALNLKVYDWDQKQFDRKRLYFACYGYKPISVQQTVRRGIPKGRDEHLPYRFVWQDRLIWESDADNGVL
jgi:DNA-3-methyladenine glycosylase